MVKWAFCFRGVAVPEGLEAEIDESATTSVVDLASLSSAPAMLILSPGRTRRVRREILGCLPLEPALGLGDGHVLAGAHPERIDLEVSEGACGVGFPCQHGERADLRSPVATRSQPAMDGLT